MAIYKKNQGVQGNWVKGKDIPQGVKAKLVSETIPRPSNYLTKDGSPKIQNIAKVRFEGSPDALNMNINRTNLDGLIDAFGEDSKNWIGKVLTVQTENVRVGGKMQTAVYLLPEGYELRNDEEGYAYITNPNKVSEPAENVEEVVDIPF